MTFPVYLKLSTRRIATFDYEMKKLPRKNPPEFPPSNNDGNLNLKSDTCCSLMQ